MNYEDSSIDKAIQKAMAEGQFKDLPGKGKPLNLSSNPFADPELDLAYSMLQNAGYNLPWIEEGQAIEAEMELTRNALRRAWAWCDQSPTSPDWLRTLSIFRQRVGEINQQVVALNLKVPNVALQRVSFNAEREIQAVIEGGTADAA